MRKTMMHLLISGFLTAATAGRAEKTVWEAEAAQFDSRRMLVVEHAPFAGGKGVMMRPDAPDRPDGDADLVFTVDVPAAGRYLVGGYAAARGEARKQLEANRAARNKQGAELWIAANDGSFFRRVAIEPWRDHEKCYKIYQKFDFAAGPNRIRINLPPEVLLDRLEIAPFRNPKPPAAAVVYRPAVTPDAARPRVWVTPRSLPQVKGNLKTARHAEVYAAVKALAAAAPPPASDPADDRELLRRIQAKALVALLEDDLAAARSAIALIVPYMANYDFSNDLDAFRRVGDAIYCAALVYDWCHAAMTPEEAGILRRKMLEFAEELSIGWPPFGQIVTNGHGNEEQLNRNLLAMAIALFGDDDTPYRYCAYRLFEELIPMRRFEYRSRRHNQGVAYGAARCRYELMAAWLLRRMAGRELFDPNMKDLGYFWVYARLPDGTMLLDGDMNLGTRYWKNPEAAFMFASYSGDPILQREFELQGGKIDDDVMFLLLNDPELRGRDGAGELPTATFFAGAQAALIARTGWNIGENSPDAVVECKGGGYYAGNHEHADAGAFQIYYKGELATDLGLYGFYGLPYDYNFNKRSIAHNVMLAYDPEEKFARNSVNDGGQRLLLQSPANLAELLKNPLYRTGGTIAVNIGPDRRRPLFAYYKTDLAAAYSKKITAYTRTFCFVAQQDAGQRAALIVLDRMTTADPGYRKYWLLNTLSRPTPGDGVLTVGSGPAGDGGGKLSLRILLPEKCTVEMTGDGAANTVFGQAQTPHLPNAPQAKGYRSMFSPAEPSLTDIFLAVMQIGDADAATPPVSWRRNAENVQIDLPGRIVVLGIGERPSVRAFVLEIPPTPDHGSIPVLLAGLRPGTWRLSAPGAKDRRLSVSSDAGSVFLVLPEGKYRMQPEP